RDYWPAGGGNTVKFARYYQSFQRRFERDQVHVRHIERISHPFRFLILEEAKSRLQIALFDGANKRIELMPSANEEENNIRAIAQLVGGGEHGLELVRASKIARIPDDEFLLEAPLRPQRVLVTRDRANLLVIRPVWNDVHAIRVHAPRSKPLA